MLDISSLYCDRSSEGDPLRYGKKNQRSVHSPSEDGSKRKPVVVFNITRSCNLECMHCYSGSRPGRFPGQLSTPEIKSVLEDLADFDVPAVLLSGGEPMVHPDFWEILEFAVELDLRVTLSTNGTLITEERAGRLKETGLTYAGISLDGMKETNDRVRGMEGAFERSVRGFRNCRTVGQKVGLRLTLTQHNVQELDEIFDFIRDEGIDRVCFYHLAYAGRGNDIQDVDLSGEERRQAVATIFRRTRDLHEHGHPVEVLTVGNYVDGVYLYKEVKKEDSQRAERIREYLRWNGGAVNAAGVGLAAIDFYGRVHPNQFWMNRTLGTVPDRKFSEIWTDESNELLHRLRHRKKYLEEPCASCEYLDLCGGGLRARAEARDDPWGIDPSCYLQELRSPTP